MRCPKCQYISFDGGDRCRNCGYEFSFATETESLDLPIQTGEEAEGPLSVPDTVPPRPITESFDLPLFSRGPVDDRPLISAPAVPRAPLSVRKPAPVAPRPPRRSPEQYEELRLDLALDEGDDVAAEEDEGEAHAPALGRAITAAEPEVAARTAPAGARLLAALIDVTLLALIDLGVLHLTLKILQLEYADVWALPAAPFVAFLLILNGSYATGFTAAGGQSIGKMAARIRVVPSDPDAWNDRVPLGQAVLRAVSYLASALPIGLGFLPALFGTEKRALHDRLAHTRVVRLALSERSESNG